MAEGNASGGEEWRPSQTAMEAAHAYLNPSSEEAGDDDGLALQEYKLAAQADVANAANASGNFERLTPDPQNPN